jgi:branched-chain amino acid transport system permease protein
MDGPLSARVLGGLLLGVLESFGARFFGPEHALTLSFIFLLFRPSGLMGKRGFV